MNEQIPYGQYRTVIFERIQAAFSTIYRNIAQPIWSDNSITAKLRVNPVKMDWNRDEYEVYIPTSDHVDYNLNFCRVRIKLLPCIDQYTAKHQAVDLMKPLVQPQGAIDSDLQVFIAPKQRGFVHGFRHICKRGHLTAIIATPNPEIAIIRLLRIIGNFFHKRLTAFMDALGFQKWEYYNYNEHTNLYYKIIAKYSYSIRQTFTMFTKLVEHFFRRIVMSKTELALESAARHAINSLTGRTKEEMTRYFSLIRSGLCVKVDFLGSKVVVSNYEEDKGVRYLEALKVIADG